MTRFTLGILTLREYGGKIGAVRLSGSLTAPIFRRVANSE
jgi:hypothetical protein